MPRRLSKSFRTGGGSRINVSRKGIGASFGGKGFRIGTGPRGLRVTAKNPITGNSMQVRPGRGRRSTPKGVGQIVPDAMETSSTKRRRKGCCLWPFVLIVLVIVGAMMMAS